MLKTLSTKSAKPKKGRVGVGGDSKAKCDGSKLDRINFNKNKVNSDGVDGDEVRENEVGKKV